MTDSTVVKIPIKADGDLEKLIVGARGLGYSQCKSDVVEIIAQMSKRWPEATLFLIEKVQALHD